MDMHPGCPLIYTGFVADIMHVGEKIVQQKQLDAENESSDKIYRVVRKMNERGGEYVTTQPARTRKCMSAD